MAGGVSTTETHKKKPKDGAEHLSVSALTLELLGRKIEAQVQRALGRGCRHGDDVNVRHGRCEEG